MAVAKKDQIRALLKSNRDRDRYPEPVSVVNEAKYIQYNPQTEEGSEGLAVLLKRLSETGPRANMVRAFEDGDFVFAHMEYDFARRNIGFEVFRFETGQAVEHWDNIPERQVPNQSDRSMVDGPTDAIDHNLTEDNRTRVRSFIETVLVDGHLDRLSDFVDASKRQACRCNPKQWPPASNSWNRSGCAAATSGWMKYVTGKPNSAAISA